jgi:hypothetical protein|tara:strand:+ start:859 stop:1203 length:345 start_codon:yes stop_codon:yes gene_type:complete
MGDISKRGHGIERRNTKRENRLEELGRVDAEKGYSRKGKRNLKDEKKRIVRELHADGGRVGAKDGKWIQKAVKGMRKDKPCTGKKFGSPTCPPGSKRYNLAKTFKKMGRERKSA